jgi:hypothetical protein
MVPSETRCLCETTENIVNQNLTTNPRVASVSYLQDLSIIDFFCSTACTDTGWVWMTIKPFYIVHAICYAAVIATQPILQLIISRKNLGRLRTKPRLVGWEAWTLPVCYAAYTQSICSLTGDRFFSLTLVKWQLVTFLQLPFHLRAQLRDTSHSLLTWHNAKLSLFYGNHPRLVLEANTKQKIRIAVQAILSKTGS